jgi:hypothetical protein
MVSSQAGIFRRKPIEDIEQAESGGLARTLGLWQLTAIGVGGIIGAGVFSLVGAVANETAGPAVLISFLIAGRRERRCRLLLRRVRRPDPACRFGVHVRLPRSGNGKD